jgi:4-amino-4-deoxy-L-arabinose transferase-like glycosyltransferase
VPRAVLPLILALAFGVRLLLGLIQPLDGDEAAEGIVAIDILHGHLAIVESGGHYLGAIESYVLAPFIAVFGPTQLAIRVALSLVGAIYVLAMYGLGRQLFIRIAKSPSAARGGGQGAGLVMASVAAVFPLFAASYGVRARNYGLLLLFVALCLLLAIRLAWSTDRRWYDWALLGLAAGIGMWNHSLLILTLLICALMIGLQLWRTGLRPADLRGVAIAVVFAVVGFAPWLGYNVVTHLGSLTSLGQATQHHATRQAMKEVFGIAIPVFLGAQRLASCGPGSFPWELADVVLVTLVAATIWLRRRSVLALLQLRWTRLAPIDFVLLLLPLSLVSVTVGPFNGASCEPRYLIPAAIPLVTIVALATTVRWRGRWLFAAAAAIWIAMTAATVANAIPDRGTFRFFDTRTAVDWPRAITELGANQPGPMWANYWVARPLQYLGNERLPVGEYGGYVGFPRLQAVAAGAARPSWVFVENDPFRTTFEAACAARGITYDRSFLSGLVLYDHLSARLTPEELGWSTTTNPT